MNNNLLKNIFSAAGQTVVQAFIFLFLYRYLLDILGVEKLGIWSIILATTSAAKVSEFGLAGSITKFVATYRSDNDDLSAAEAIQTAAITIGVFLGAILLLIYLPLQSLMPFILPEEGIYDGLSILPYALISLWLASVSAIWANSLDGCMRSDLRAILMIIGYVVLFGTSVFMVETYGLIGLAFAQIAQGMVVLILGWLTIKAVIPPLPILPFQWRYSSFRKMLSYGVNLQINSIVMMLFDPITKVLLGRYGELSIVGYFEMAQRLIMMFRNLIIASNRVIVPVFASMHREERKAQDNLYILNLRYLIFFATPLFSILFSMIPIISEVWIGLLQDEFIIIGLSLAISWYLNTITAPAYFAYLGNGKLFWVTLSHAVMGGMNIVLGIFFGYLFGWTGVLFGYGLALVVGSFIPAYTYQRETKLKISEVLSKDDVIFVLTCFSSALLTLSIYWNMVINGLGGWRSIIVVFMSIIAVNIFAIWRHPIRKELLSKYSKKNNQA